jgi:arylsulfatase A-like enzyme
MRIPILGWFAVALLVAPLGCVSSDSPQHDRPPNFIVILTDDQGFGDVGIHGNADIRTPTLDRFATEGVELTRFYVEPVCAPTRAALMTGRYHYRSGVIHTSRGGAKMHGEENTVAEMLRGAGYRTGLFGKWHLGDNYPMRPTDQGFEEALWHKSGGIGQAPDKPNSYFDPWLWRNNEKVSSEGYCTDIFFDGAMDFAERHQDEPFFIYLPTNAPHTPLEVAESYWKPYAEAGLDETTARVYGMVENIDQNLERLLNRLDQLGLRDNTAIAVISDNGPQQSRYTAELRGLKGTTYEGGIRALSFWQWPDGIEGGRRLDPVAAHIDVAPTLLEWAGIAPPSGRPFDGVSLAPLFRGEPILERTHFSQVHRGLTPKLYQNAAVVSGQYKLVLGPDTFANEDWSYSGEPQIELYDLAADPSESHDIASEDPALASELRRRYEDWFSDVRATRDFAPGVIRIDSRAEDPVVLSRYQDSTFIDGVPTSWNIAVAEAGRYQLQVETAGDSSAATIHVDISGKRQEFPLLAGSRSVTVDLPAGPAELDVWVQSAGNGRQILTDNSTLGDVTISRVR